MQTLPQKLDAFRIDFETNKAPKEALAVMHRATKELADSGQKSRAIKLGDTFPEFALPNQNGDIVKLSDLLKNGPVVVSFFRGVWCPYCNIELNAIGEIVDGVRAAGGELVVISPSVQKMAQRAIKDNKLKCDVLSDAGNAFADELGVKFRLSDELEALYKSFGVDLPGNNGDDSWTLPMPTRAVIGQDGVIRYLDINADYTRRPDTPETLAVVRSLTLQAAA